MAGRAWLKAGAIALMLAPAPGLGQAPAPDCAAITAERADLVAQRQAVKTIIADIALGRHHRRRPVKAGDVAGAAAGTAASLLLPFGVGLLLGVGASAARGRKRKAAPDPGPDVPALIARQNAIEARLAKLASISCPSAPPPAAAE